MVTLADGGTIAIWFAMLELPSERSRSLLSTPERAPLDPALQDGARWAVSANRRGIGWLGSPVDVWLYGPLARYGGEANQEAMPT